VKYACITEHRDSFSLLLMCRLLEVTRSGYYAAQHRPPSARTQADATLRLHVRAAHAASRRRYGAPMITQQLKRRGIPCGRHRVARLLREAGLQGKATRKFRVTTRAAAAHPVAPNHLARRFAPAAIGGINRVWAADLTFLPTRAGWLYLAVVLDVGSRRVIGWAMDRTITRALPLAALRMALAQRGHPAHVLHHSDRGRQYSSAEYQAVLARADCQVSMSRKGDCWDNAVVESFFATLKTELADDADWPTRADAQRAVFEYLEIWYNRQRLHSTLNYHTPVEYEAALETRSSAA